ncbi:hypothetical protein G6F65_019995 [Rhizopus arrhizus]|nr:hypothetical protein G6F65_019995 [Rhizopus arrhizus]
MQLAAQFRRSVVPVPAQLDTITVTPVQHRHPGQLRQAIAARGEHGHERIARQQAVPPEQVGLGEGARGEHARVRRARPATGSCVPAGLRRCRPAAAALHAG